MYKDWQASQLIGKGGAKFVGFERVYHVHLRKTAGTSLNSAFWNLGGLDLNSIQREPIAVKKGWVFVRNNLDRIQGGDYHYANSHIPIWNIELPENTFTFCMFREPVERLLSLYTYYLWIDSTSSLEGLKIEPFFDSIKSKLPHLGNDFGDFILGLPKKHLMNQLFMFSAEYDVEVALKNVEKLHGIYFQSHFDEAVKDLSNRLGVPLVIRRERKFPKPKIQVTEEQRQQAIQLLDKEYTFYDQVRSKYLNS